jgi:hypothetical protein
VPYVNTIGLNQNEDQETGERRDPRACPWVSTLKDIFSHNPKMWLDYSHHVMDTYIVCQSPNGFIDEEK